MGTDRGEERPEISESRPRGPLLRRALACAFVVAVLLVALHAAGVALPLIGGGGHGPPTADGAPSAIEEEGADGSGSDRPVLQAAPKPATHEDGPKAPVEATSIPLPAAKQVVLEGSVVRGDGHPARRARVTAVDGAGLSVSADADGNGRFSLTLPPGRYDLILRGGMDGSLVARGVRVEPGAKADLSFTLGGASSIRVEVTQDGKRYVGADVRVFLKFDGVQERLAEGKTDLGGTFVAETLPSGPYTVEVQVTDGVVYTRGLELAQDATVAFDLPGTARLSGFVGDAQTKAPLEARIDVGVQVNGGASVLATTRSDARGLFLLDVPRGKISSFLVVGPDEYAPFPMAREAGPVFQSLRPLQQGQAVEKAVDLRLGASVVGTVVLEGSESPVADLALRLQSSTGTVRTGTTAKDGTYRIVGAGAGRHQLLVATPGWYLTTPDRVEVPAPSGDGSTNVPFDVRVTSAGAVSGVVVTGDDRPVAGARVWLVGGQGTVRAARRAGRDLETTTASDGTFSLDDVPPTTWCRLRAAFGEAEATPSAAFRTMDGVPGPFRLSLQPTGTIRGHVVDVATRTPIDGARVRIDPIGEPDGRSSKTVTSGANGAFEAGGLIPGRWRLKAEKRDYLDVPAVEVDLTAEARVVEQDANVDSGLVVAGTVTDGAGNPLPARVSIDGTVDGTPPRDLHRQGRADARGVFRWQALRSGSYAVSVSMNGFRPARVDRLRGGEDRLRVVLEPAPPPGR
jgi:hypothetical protein